MGQQLKVRTKRSRLKAYKQRLKQRLKEIKPARSAKAKSSSTPEPAEAKPRKKAAAKKDSGESAQPTAGSTASS